MASKREDIETRLTLRDQISVGLGKVSANAEKTRSSINELGGSFGRAGLTSAIGLAVAAAAAFPAAAGASVVAAGSLQSAVLKAAEATRATAGEFDLLKKAATDQAAAFGISANITAAALEQLGRDGFNATEAIAALPDALALATGKSIELTSAIGAAGGVIDAFSLSNTDAGAVIDQLAAKSTAAGAGVLDFATALSSLGQGAQQVRVDLDLASSAVALLAQNGIEGGKAAGALNGIFAALRDPASALSKELDKLGITTRDFGEVVQQLGAKGAAGSAALESLGSKGTTALRILTADGGQAIAEFSASIGTIEGAAQRSSDATAGIERAFNRLTEVIKASAVKLADPILEPLTQELLALGERLKLFAESPEFAALGENIRVALVGARDALLEFGNALGLGEFTAKLTETGSITREELQSIVDAARTAGLAIRNSFLIGSSLIDGVQLAVAGVVAAFARVGIAANNLAQDVARATGASAETIRLLEERGVILAGIYEDATASIRENTKQINDNIAAIGETPPALTAAAAAVEQLTLVQQANSEVTAQATTAVTALDAANRSAIDSGIAQSFRDQGIAIGEIGEKAAVTVVELGKIKEPISGATEEVKKTTQAAAELTTALDDVAASGQGIGESIQQGASGAAPALQRVADSAQDLRDEIDAGDRAMEDFRRTTRELVAVLGEGSEAFGEQSVALNKLVQGVGGVKDWLEAVTRLVNQKERQQELATAELRQLQETNAAYDENAKALNRLRSQYPLLGDETLKQIARERELSAERRKRAAEDKERADEEIQRAKEREERDRTPRPTPDPRPSPSPDPGPTRVDSTINIRIDGFGLFTDRSAIEELVRRLVPEIRRQQGLNA